MLNNGVFDEIDFWKSFADAWISKEELQLDRGNGFFADVQGSSAGLSYNTLLEDAPDCSDDIELFLKMKGKK